MVGRPGAHTSTLSAEDLKPRAVDHPNFHIYLPDAARRAREYLARQWRRTEILQTQRTHLASCLLKAALSVPAYRALGVDTHELGDDPYAVLKKFPLLTKPQIQDRLEDYVSDDLEATDCFKVSTSGSTGVPLQVVHDGPSLVHESAAYARLLDCRGVVPGERVARIVSDRSRPMWQVNAQLFGGPIEVAVVNILTPEQEWCVENLDRLLAWQPVGLFGNPSDLLALAILLQEQETTLPSVRFAGTGGENLDDCARRTIEEVLERPVYDCYAMEEVSCIAWQCEQGVMHVDQDRVFVEEVPSGNGDPELVVTPLCNYTMPLIRYRTGDLGRVVAWGDEPCACGRKFDSLVDFLGRDRGFIVFPDGRLYSPKPVKLFLTEQPLAAWQLIQEETDSVKILIAPRAGVNPKSTAKIVRTGVSALLGNRISVEVTVVQPRSLVGGARKFQMMRLHAYSRSVEDCRVTEGGVRVD